MNPWPRSAISFVAELGLDLGDDIRNAQVHTFFHDCQAAVDVQRPLAGAIVCICSY